MKRASYRQAVEWIALNDNTGGGERADEIASYVSTLLVADLFGVEPEKVGKDIERARVREGHLEKPPRAPKVKEGIISNIRYYDEEGQPVSTDEVRLGTRILLRQEIRQMLAPKMRESGFYKTGNNSPVLLCSFDAGEYPGIESANGSYLNCIMGFTEEGVVVEAHAGGMVIAHWEHFDLADLTALRNFLRDPDVLGRLR